MGFKIIGLIIICVIPIPDELSKIAEVRVLHWSYGRCKNQVVDFPGVDDDFPGNASTSSTNYMKGESRCLVVEGLKECR